MDSALKAGARAYHTPAGCIGSGDTTFGSRPRHCRRAAMHEDSRRRCAAWQYCTKRDHEAAGEKTGRAWGPGAQGAQGAHLTGH